MKKLFTIQIDFDHLEALRQLADEQYTSVGAIVRQAIAAYLSQHSTERGERDKPEN
jgi:predicted transcriptional regulator